MIATLPTELTIAKAGEIQTALLAALATGEPIELDGHAVEEVDVAGLQVLYAAGRSAATRGVPFGFRRDGRSAALVRALEVAGLAHNDREIWLMQEGA